MPMQSLASVSRASISSANAAKVGALKKAQLAEMLEELP